MAMRKRDHANARGKKTLVFRIGFARLCRVRVAWPGCTRLQPPRAPPSSPAAAGKKLRAGVDSEKNRD
jgi:hypothetical protein